MPQPELRSPLLIPLATDGVRLEPIRSGHADPLFEGLREPSLYAYDIDRPPVSLAALRRRYASLASGRSPYGDQHWLNWVVVPDDAAVPVGSVQATVDDDLSAASIGYLIVRAFQHRGIATAAVRRMVEHLVASGVALIEATVDVRNVPSIALAERIGFTRTSTHRSEDVIAGVRGFDHTYVLRGSPRRSSPGA